jgi:GntR family uxuAB operon transcriptional repressor
MYRSDQSDAFTPIGAPRRRYLHVAEQLLQAIADGVYAPGSRIPGDREIAASTHVSRPTVREAVLALEIVGVVEVQPGAGVFVSRRPAGQQILDPLALDAPRELIEARAAIEPLVAGLCAERIDTAAIGELRALTGQGADATSGESQSLSRMSELGLLFHRRLASACGNRILAEMTCGLVDMERHPLWVLVNQIALRSQDARDMQIQEHASILDAIEAGDAARAQAVMAQHLESTRAVLFGAEVSTSAGAC